MQTPADVAGVLPRIERLLSRAVNDSWSDPELAPITIRDVNGNPVGCARLAKIPKRRR